MTRSLVDCLDRRGELDERIRLRIAFDVLASLGDVSDKIDERTSDSRLHLARVRIGANGTARVHGDGATTGAALLLWELLAGRAASDARPGRIHDLVDEIHPDVDDVIASALKGRFASIDELREALLFAGEGRVATHESVSRELGSRLGARVAAPDAPQDLDVLATGEELDLLSSARAPFPAPLPADLLSGFAPIEANPSVDAETESPLAPPLVVVASQTERIDGELMMGLRAAGFGVVVVRDAERAQSAVCGWQLACVICDEDLADASGSTLVRKIRRLDASVAGTPIVLIASPAATSDRVARFSTGADICLLKPYASAEVVAQVLALHQMSSRLRETRDALSRFPAARGRAFGGDLAQFSIAAVLTVLDMERRTGVFHVSCGPIQAELVVVAGHATDGTLNGASTGVLDVMLAIASFTHGRFSFTTRVGIVDVPDDAIRLGHLLVEATRQSDEMIALSDARIP